MVIGCREFDGWLARYADPESLKIAPRLQSINLNNGAPSLHSLVSPDPIFSEKEVSDK